MWCLQQYRNHLSTAMKRLAQALPQVSAWKVMWELLLHRSMHASMRGIVAHNKLNR